LNSPTTGPLTSGPVPVRQYRIVLPAGIPLLNANQRLHHRVVTARKIEIRDTALVMTRYAKVPRMQRAHAFFIVRPLPVNRDRDPANWAPSAKAAIDGMVRAGVLPDDDSTHLIGPDGRLGTPVKGAQLVLVITDLATVQPDFLTFLDPTRQLAYGGL
jgi:hypothetical protein